MNLTLVAVSLNDQPLSQPITAVFDARGGTIGRADHNTMALPDPQRHVSRLQAEIVAQGTSFIIRNVGAANPIIVNGRTLAHGDTAPLVQDEQVRIGGYLLQARVDLAAQAAATVHAHRTETWAPPAPTVAAPFADLLGPTGAVAAGNPFSDLMGPIANHAGSPPSPFADLMPPPAGVDPRSAAVSAPPATAPRLPDDFDPFGAPAAPAQGATTAPAADPFADLMTGARDTSIDHLFGLGGGSEADPLSKFLGAPMPAAAAAAGAMDGGLSTDPLALFGHAPTTPEPPMAMAQADNVSALHGAYAPPLPVQRVQPVPQPPPQPAPLAAVQDGADLWAAFCTGAGIPSVAPAGTPQQQMHELGRILRGAVDGILQLIAVRASTKHELRAGVTVIQQRNNNPLKFSPDAGAALTQLLQPPMRGFLDGPAAMEDAMHDLVGHSIGTVAGLRAAVEGMLDRFSPDALESKLTSQSMFDHLLPGNRKARLWDLYLEHHESIREEAQEDFHTLFGKAFLAAYQQQIERLQRSAGQR